MTSASIRETLFQAALSHVPFDGWGDATFQAAIEESNITAELARAVCPRGATDLATAYHEHADRLMQDELAAQDLSALRFRDRVATAVRIRLQVSGDKDIVRRGVAHFAMPHLMADGTRLIWNTCDLIWTVLGDSSTDINWYTKRGTLSGVYSSTLLYWLGDTSDGDAATWAFLDRRIDNVMQIETFKAKARGNSFLSTFLRGPAAILGQVQAPDSARKKHMPGRWQS